MVNLTNWVLVELRDLEDLSVASKSNYNVINITGSPIASGEIIEL
jgi:hypothetical protein